MLRLPDRRHRPLGIAFLLGLTSVLAFAPIGFFPLIFATLGGLYGLLAPATEKRTAREGGLIGGAFGLGLFIGGVSWVYVSLSVFGGMVAPLAGTATILFCSVLALLPAAAGATYARFAPDSSWQRALLFAALWTLGEWVRSWLFSGFPWLAVGYTQTPPSPLAGFAPIFGVYGVSWLTAWLGALLTIVIRAARDLSKPARSKPALLAALSIAVTLGAGGWLRQMAWTHASGPTLSVSLLQGNIPQDIKWRPEWFHESLNTYYQLAHDNPAQLTVLPETAIPSLLGQLPPGYLEALRALALRENGELMLGIAIGNASVYTNSVISVGTAPMQRYHKSHLVPFGEFVPPGFRWVLDLVQIPMSDYTPGVQQQSPFQIGPLKIAPNICYEDAFGEEIIRALPEADVLVNFSNVAWFGDSLAPAQHLQIARMRALETGRMMLRATNTGMTAIIDADGRVVSALKPFTRAALRGEVKGYTGTTPFVRWGNGPIVIFCGLIFAAAIASLSRRKRVS